MGVVNVCLLHVGCVYSLDHAHAGGVLWRVLTEWWTGINVLLF